MKILLIGTGKMGKAIAHDLIHHQQAAHLTLANRTVKKAESLQKWLGSKNTDIVPLSIESHDDLVNIMRGHDCVISAVSYQHNFNLAQAAVDAEVNYCDLGQNVNIVDREFSLSEKAASRNLTIVPDGGLAPGMVNIIAAHGIRKFNTVDSVFMRVGGLPQDPQPPLNYNITWSVSGLVNEYCEKARILRNHEYMEVNSLEEPETISFHYPYNRMEAFITSGGSSTLPLTYQGRIRELNYKTIRYPNHYHIMKAFISLGFTSKQSIIVDQVSVKPRAVLEQLLKNNLVSENPEDVVLLRVTIQGKRNGKQETDIYEMIDYYDPQTGLTAMMRTTGFSLAIVAGMIARGTIDSRGVLTQEECIPGELYFSELQKRGIEIIYSTDGK